MAAAAGVLAAITIQSLLFDLDSFPLGDMLAMVIATYAVGAYADRRAGVIGLLLAATGAVAHAAVFYPEGVVAALLGGVVLPWTVGRLVSGDRRLMLVEREKAVEVERSRAREAAAAVTSERMRVARELHDAVAHNLSVIAIQAGGAEGIVERDRGRAAEIAALIGSVARETLAELGRLAGAADGGRGPGPRRRRTAHRARARRRPGRRAARRRPRAGAPGRRRSRRVPDRAGGARQHRQARAGRPCLDRRPLPGPRARAGDRRRRARPQGSRARARRRARAIGMRERVALYGGSLDLGRHPGGGFLVRARMPIEGA